MVCFCLCREGGCGLRQLFRRLQLRCGQEFWLLPVLRPKLCPQPSDPAPGVGKTQFVLLPRSFGHFQCPYPRQCKCFWLQYPWRKQLHRRDQPIYHRIGHQLPIRLDGRRWIGSGNNPQRWKLLAGSDNQFSKFHIELGCWNHHLPWQFRLFNERKHMDNGFFRNGWPNCGGCP